MSGIGVLILFVSSSNTYAASTPGYFDIIGLNVLRAATTNLDGTGVRVAQVEAQSVGNGDWEVTPSATGIGLLVSDFTAVQHQCFHQCFPERFGN